jgi:O-antigen ligase
LFWLKKLLSFVFSKESLFVLFLYAGFFKSAVPFPVDLTVVFLLLSFLLAIKELMNKSVFTRGVGEALTLFSLFTIVILISTFYTPSYGGFEKAIHFTIITGWSFIGPLFIINSKESLHRFFTSLFAVGVVTSLFALKEFLTNDNAFFIMVFGSDYLALGRVVGSASLIILVTLMIQKVPAIKKVMLLSVIFLMIFVMVLSGGRAPIFFLLLVVFIYSLFQLKINFKTGVIRYRKSFIYFLFFIMAGVTFFLKSNVAAFETLKTRIGHAFTQGGGESIAGRTDRFETALDMIAEKPFFGYGIDAFSHVYGSGKTDWPHNIFLEIASELGLFGLILFLSMLLLAGFRFFETAFLYSTGEFPLVLKWQLLLLFFYSFINANVSGTIIGNRILFTFIAIFFISNRLFSSHNKIEYLKKSA